MSKRILFIQGGGDGGYEVDKELVISLHTALGIEYEIDYPEIQSAESEPDFGWLQQIHELLSETEDDVILAGHSLGASMLLKYLSESVVDKKIAGVFLLATPFWNGHEEWKQGLKLQANFADKLPHEISLFFYHCRDDEEVPFSHLSHYKQKLTRATFREIEKGGHQFNSALHVVASDIKTL